MGFQLGKNFFKPLNDYGHSVVAVIGYFNIRRFKPNFTESLLEKHPRFKKFRQIFARNVGTSSIPSPDKFSLYANGIG